MGVAGRWGSVWALVGGQAPSWIPGINPGMTRWGWGGVGGLAPAPLFSGWRRRCRYFLVEVLGMGAGGLVLFE